MQQKKPQTTLIVIIAAVVVLFVIGAIIISTISKSNAQAAQATGTAEAIAVADTATALAVPTSTPTTEPTPLPTETPTIVPTETPTSTFTPTLGVDSNSVTMWVIPQEYSSITLTSLGSRDDYTDATVGTDENGVLNIQVPGSYIVVEATFTQPIPSGTKIQFFEQGAVSPWYETTLSMDANNANKGIALLNHTYLVNPPYWEITYHAKIVDSAGQVYWEKDVRVFKSSPNTCWNGTMPDPVTLYCPSYDGDWNYLDFENFNPDADIFTSGQVPLPDKYKGQ